ncbi:vacuolar protein sorting-associated protein 36 [Zea mays]|uniref:Vacuolar protein-sorting-associated protein 36 n=1 Tax=Zea mays TaxID=4577 RepID=A0A1D6N918_MAIZE|nr:vacuolar protein sorting-associated protein 36 [Zea mays]ONM37038.1 Vacuolar protein sorting-associated protein 36 [Zea mays]|eukprot:XP_020406024.1 vacuolar protein sorting-associated protein 36 [Zea mays]
MSAAAADWLPSASVTASGRPVLSAGEVERNLVPLVDLEPEENPHLAPLRACLLALTSHRLIFLHEPSRSARGLPLATVVHAYPPHRRHNHNPLRSLFSSSSSSSSQHHRIRLQISMPSVRSEVIAIVVTCKADVDVFFGRLLEAIRARAWEVAPAAAPSSSTPVADVPAENVGIRMPVVGVSGILRMEQESWESAGQNLQDAFQDLNALMGKAKEMMQLAEKMRLKLLMNSSTESNSNDEEMGSKQDMQDLLLSVGIVSPVTKETAGALYHQQLSLQLADFVRIPLEKAGGMMALVDVYCLFNRARGTELISPEDLLQACSLWEKVDVQVMLRKFDSGVKVIQTKTHSDEEVFARISSLAQKQDALQKGISPSDAAFTLGIAPALAKEHLLNAENKGLLCRDVSPDGFRFFINLFNDIDAQNIYSQKPYGPYNVWISVAMTSH